MSLAIQDVILLCSLSDCFGIYYYETRMKPIKEDFDTI